MTANKTPPRIRDGQVLHLVCSIVLLAVVWSLWRYLEKPFPFAFWTAVAFPLAHQWFVWLTWRLELRSSAISKTMRFRGYLVVFFLLFGGRFVSLIFLGWLDRGSLGLPVVSQVVLTLLLALPGFYSMYSVMRYFGMIRAAGADHFDPKYREMPLVRQGIFQFTSNGMYWFAFLLFWAIAVGFNRRQH